MNKYITFREGENEPDYFILQRDFPHYVAKICETVDSEDWCTEQIDGYNLHLVFSGVINGRYIPSTGSIEEMYAVLRDMSLWYLSNRISKKEKKYKKFKDDSFSNKPSNSNS
jgi:hypothetical protein